MEVESSRKRKQADICLQRTSDEYTVGWICAICTEYTAAQAALDEEHERPDDMAPGDYNDYTVGRIGKHNVVIAVLPDGEYGIDSAALVARDMLHSFANIKVGLMVGIGGGAPSDQCDIRLGDIAVSTPREGHSGVLQYDFGKMVQGEPFRPTRLLNQSPRILRAAVNGLKSQHQHKGYGQLREMIEGILQNNPNLQREFGRPDLTSDRLYRSGIVHPANGISTPDCSVSCGDGPSKLVVRTKRIVDEGAPVVHYGLIASANTLMKDAVLRDKLALEKNIICFEMEAAGLMNQFPCLVVRGICDYSDSHKNKRWQGYAAIAAAAYAKDLLYRIPPDNISMLQRVNREKKAQILSEKQEKAFYGSLKFDQHKDRHDNIRAAHAETCKWLPENVVYLDWLDPDKIHDHHGFLWIKGKPGAGKSTTMKFALVTARKMMRNRIVISFFFNARGGNLEKSTLGMYRSLLLQLLQQLPAIQDELDLSDFLANHETYYRWHVEPLKSLFHQAIENIRKSKVVCFIDALDECDHDEVRDMISFFEFLGDLATSKGSSFLICFSSRHYPYISIQNGLSLILENQREHAQDIVKYMRSELKIGQDNIANQIHADIPKRSRGVFMWVILVVLILNKEYDKGRVYNLQTKYQEIPGDLHELFRNILTRNSDGNSIETLRCLQWILFAGRPLKPEELYFAVLSDVSPTWVHRETLEHDIQRFVLDSSLGFADIIASNNYYMHKTVQFIHESVKDFLLKENGLREIWTDSTRNIYGQSHEELKQCCLRWIAMGSATRSQDSSSERRTIVDQWASKELPFLNYAIHNVLFHANLAQKYGISQAGFLREFEATSWIIIRSTYKTWRDSSDPRLLYTLAEKNMSHLTGCHPSKLAFSELGDEYFGTPLLTALANGSNEVILEFLKAQAENTPEFHDLHEEYCRKSKGNMALLSILFEKCMTDVNKLPRFSSALLQTAIEKGHGEFVELLLQKGAKIDARNSLGNMALHFAVEGNQKAILQLLIKAGADIEAYTLCGCITPLALAATKGYVDMATQLIISKARIDATDGFGYTPLLLAAEKGHKDMVALLLEKGCNIEATGKDGETPLTQAAKHGYEDVADMLLEEGANIEAINKNGQTPLMWAIRKKNPGLVRLLLNRGAKVTTGKVANIRPTLFEFSFDFRRRILANRELTLLEFAQQFEETEIIELLSRYGAT